MLARLAAYIITNLEMRIARAHAFESLPQDGDCETSQDVSLSFG